MLESEKTPSHPTSPETSSPSGPPARCCGRGRRRAARLLVLGLVAVGAFAAFRAFAQGGPHGLGHGPFAAHSFCSGDPDRHVARAVGWLMDDLKGTPDQEQKLTAIGKAAVADLCALKSQARENHLQAAVILTKETVDRAALEAVRAKQMELANAASVRLTKAIADAADVLTPAQRVELAARARKLHG